MRTRSRLARDLHPGAWWLWALGMATAASRTTNPLLLGLVIAVVAFVVSARRGDAPWARGFTAYLVLGLVIIAFRVLFRMVFDAQYGEHVLFTLPEIPLPEVAAGVRVGGPVSLEGILAALYDGLRLATLLICLGAANVLANPKRLLKALPSALYEAGVAVTVALTIAPQLVESAQRITRARRLRGEVGRRTRWFRQVAVPVMTDALDRSLLLAAAMDSRGYGRTVGVSPATRVLTGSLVVAGLVGVCMGTYGLLDAATPRVLGMPLIVVGIVVAGTGMWISGRRLRRSRYRPDRWRTAEMAVAASGIAVGAVLYVSSGIDPTELNPSLSPLEWPSLPPAATIGVLFGTLPAWLAPPPRRSGAPPVLIRRTDAAPARDHPPTLHESLR